MALRERPSKKGAISKYISRKQALKQLMISLVDFRILCVLKGVFPKVPPSFKRLNDGGCKRKVYYDRRDITYLSHDHLIEELRSRRTHKKKAFLAYKNKEKEKIQKLNKVETQIDVSHVIRERYPNFDDAIGDLDDCLTTCSAFINLCKTRTKSYNQLNLSRRLVSEFQNYVIMTRALRKVFVTIKGFYFQAEICGRLVTWLMPHCNGPVLISENTDMKLITNFALLYTTLLGFVNYRLYQSKGLNYPPKMNISTNNKKKASKEFDTITSLCYDFEVNLDEDDENTLQVKEEQLRLQYESDEEEEFNKAKEELVLHQKSKRLFEGLKFFINSECPRDYLVFIIRSLGGQVSFDSFLGPGATFSEDDESITHQVVDRPEYKKRFLSRTYIQPQWLFDSLNQGKLLNTSDYLIGTKLPPHFSPFVTGEDPTQVYVSTERAKQLGIKSSLEVEPKERLEIQEKLAKGTKIVSQKKKSAYVLNKKETQTNVDVNVKEPETASSHKRKQATRERSEKAEQDALAVSTLKHSTKHLYKKLKFKEKAQKKLKDKLLRKKLAQ